MKSNVFGNSYKSSHKYAMETMEYISKNNILDSSGIILPHKHPLLSKSQIWGYIHHVIFQNKKHFENIKSTITFRNDVQNMVTEFLVTILDPNNISKYINKQGKLIYLTKIHLIMFATSVSLKASAHQSESTNKELMDKLIIDEENKFTKLIDDIEKTVHNPKLNILHDDKVREVTLSLRQKRVQP